MATGAYIQRRANDCPGALLKQLEGWGGVSEAAAEWKQPSDV